MHLSLLLAIQSLMMKTHWVLVTGQPGCGKTTACKKLLNHLEKAGVACKGFYTEEVRDSASKSRIGFDIVTIPDGKRGRLARKEGYKSKFKTGQYFVDVDSFESLALPSLSWKNVDAESTVFILDEIGRMELHSKLFESHVRSMLDQNIRLMGAVTAPRYGHRVPFCDEVTSHDGVEVHNLTKKTRDEILESLIEKVGTEWLLLKEE